MIKYLCDKCGAELPQVSDRYTKKYLMIHIIHIFAGLIYFAINVRRLSNE